jgi:penicillin G amidase
MRRAIIVVLTLALLLPVGLLARGAAADPVDVPGLEGPARIDRDGNGIAHIRAGTRHDLFLLQGWVHAQDRLFQMDVRRRQADGTLAELLGPAALPTDVQLRTIGLHRAAARSLPALSADARAVLAAYADGVNAWVAEHPLPPEYGALSLTSVRPWTALDSVAVGKLQAFGLSFDLDIELTTALLGYQQAGQAAGFDGTALFFQDLWRSEPFTHASTVPDASQGAGAAAPAATGRAAAALAAGPAGERLRAAGRLAERYAAVAAKVPLLRQALAQDRGQTGSNQWAVSGREAAGGHPLLANDPHLALDSPSTFYPVHLQAGETDAIGSGFAGAPGVIVGNNRFISWGATVNPMDVTDTYAEQLRPDPSSPSGLATVYQGRLEPVIPIPETFRQNNPGSGTPDNLTVVPPGGAIPPATLIVPRRNNGPILQLDRGAGTALSVQYTGFSATREIDTVLIWDDARNLDDFRRGLELFDVGGQNWAYADVEGNIAYFTSAELPLREDLQAGAVHGLPPFFIRNGTGGNEWLPVRNPQPGQAIPYEILPYSEMPQLLNPPAGFFVNANNDPAGTTLDNDPLNQTRPGGGIYYLNNGYAGIRGGRITALIRAELAGAGTVSFADSQRIQADTALVDAQFFVPHLVRALARGAVDSDPTLRGLARDPAVAEAVGRLALRNRRTPTGIAEGYDAADTDGQRQPPTRLEQANSAAATIYGVWRGQVIKGAIDARLAPFGVPVPDGERSLTALKHLLETFADSQGVGASGIAFFAVEGVADPADRRDVVLLSAVQAALARLAGPDFQAAFGGSADQGDYRWGRLHRVTMDHPLGGPFNIPPAFGAFPPPLADLPGIPTDGGFETVDASAHDARADAAGEFGFGGGPANRYVSEARAPGDVRAESSLPGGTSGIPGTPFSVNLLPGWLTNDTFPLEQGAAG